VGFLPSEPTSGLYTFENGGANAGRSQGLARLIWGSACDLETEARSGSHREELAARAASGESEKEIILRALTRTRWNRCRAAEELQISYEALLYKLKQMGCSEYGAS
jgi:transcriptional regulator with PAS, ATPase and Fis domain